MPRGDHNRVSHRPAAALKRAAVGLLHDERQVAVGEPKLDRAVVAAARRSASPVAYDMQRAAVAVTTTPRVVCASARSAVADDGAGRNLIVFYVQLLPVLSAVTHRKRPPSAPEIVKCSMAGGGRALKFDT